ncbi:uncharacterized protein ACIBXB_005894 [Morphnus guianensis]
MFEGRCASEVLQSAPQCAEYTGAHFKYLCTNACSTLAISVGVGDGDPCSNKDAKVVDVLETTEAPEINHIGIRASPPKKVVGSIAQLKCIYTNTHSMGNKQEEAIVQLENYDVIAITETWWDDSHNWSAAMDGYKLFRRDRQGRRGGGVALYVRECFDCLELDDGDERVECLWVRIGERPTRQISWWESVIDHPNRMKRQIFYKQLGGVSQSLALVLMGAFNLPDVCWKYNTAERKQSRRFLECVEDNFLTQLVSEPTRESAPLDLLFVNREGLVGDVMVGGHLGHSNHEIIVFDSQRSKEGGQQKCYLGLLEGRLWPV